MIHMFPTRDYYSASCPLWALTLCVCLVGCSQQEQIKRYGVRGTILLDGKPVVKGPLRFTPDVDSGNRGPESVAYVRDGQFQLKADQGLVEGPYFVEVTVVNKKDEVIGAAKKTLNVAAKGENSFQIDIATKELRAVKNEEGGNDRGGKGEG
jgi:hypothetical protein